MKDKLYDKAARDSDSSTNEMKQTWNNLKQNKAKLKIEREKDN